jgi:hypothetical protein
MSQSNAQNGQQQNGGNKPAQTFRYRAVKCVIWRNDGRNGAFYSTVITRSYKDGEDWKESHSFGQEDLPSLAKAALDAHSWIQEQLNRDREAAESGRQDSQARQQTRQRSGSREPVRS